MKPKTFRISDLLTSNTELLTLNGLSGEVSSLELTVSDGSRYRITPGETGGLRITSGGGLVLQPVGLDSLLLKQGRIESVKGMEE